MLKWLKSKLKSKKAQFFVISTVLVASALASISGYLQGYAKTPLSESHVFKGNELFLNIKEQMNETVINSSCDLPGDQPRKRNLQEFKMFAGKKMGEKGRGLNITYTDYCPEAEVIMVLKTSDGIVRDEFTLP